MRTHPSRWDVVNPHRAWFTNLAKYRRAASWGDYLAAYTQARTWFNETVATDPTWAFTETSWCLLRQPFRHRWTRWDHVLAHMGAPGAILDWGCGTGEMLAWLIQRRPEWIHDGHDLPSPHYAYAQHRGFAPLGNWQERRYQIITCYETLEHVADPVGAVESMLARLSPGGVLLWDFINDQEGGNVATRDARGEVLRMLSGTTGQRECYRMGARA